MYGYGYGSGSWMHGPWMFGGGFMPILWIVLVAVAVVFVFNFFRRSKDVPGGKTALDILKERYARGEIEKDEFDRKKRELAS